jgi:hypothetical protein
MSSELSTTFQGTPKKSRIRLSRSSLGPETPAYKMMANLAKRDLPIGLSVGCVLKVSALLQASAWRDREPQG